MGVCSEKFPRKIVTRTDYIFVIQEKALEIYFSKWYLYKLDYS